MQWYPTYATSASQTVVFPNIVVRLDWLIVYAQFVQIKRTSNPLSSHL